MSAAFHVVFLERGRQKVAETVECEITHIGIYCIKQLFNKHTFIFILLGTELSVFSPY